MNHTDELTTPVRTARSRRSRRLVAVGAIGGALAIGGAAAAAAGVFSTDTVERGMPGGSVIFTDTDPTCTTSDGIVFDCTLAHAPTAEVLDDYTDAGELIVDDESASTVVAVVWTPRGMHWTCYIGERAVEEGILVADLLGQVSGPTSG